MLKVISTTTVGRYTVATNSTRKIIGTKHPVTVPLKCKLPPSQETRLVSLETRLVSFESFLVSRECTASTSGEKDMIII